MRFNYGFYVAGSWRDEYSRVYRDIDIGSCDLCTVGEGHHDVDNGVRAETEVQHRIVLAQVAVVAARFPQACLLYTSDAADDLLQV